MANNVITIDPKKVNDAGKEIVEQGNRMYNALKDISDIIDGTKKCFQSDGGDSARANFKSSAAKFEDFKKFIHEYGQFLQSYGSAHQKMDSEVSTLANKIPKL